MQYWMGIKYPPMSCQASSSKHTLVNPVLLELGLYTETWLTFSFHKTVVEKCLGTIVPSFPCI